MHILDTCTLYNKTIGTFFWLTALQNQNIIDMFYIKCTVTLLLTNYFSWSGRWMALLTLLIYRYCHRLSQRTVFESGQANICWQNSELDISKTKLRPNSSISSLVQAEQWTTVLYVWHLPKFYDKYSFQYTVCTVVRSNLFWFPCILKKLF